MKQTKEAIYHQNVSVDIRAQLQSNIYMYAQN
jgi:hypothetical protein